MKLKKNLIPVTLILLIIMFLTSCAMHPLCPAYAIDDSQKKEKCI